MPTQTINLNNTTPAAPSNALNVKWQADAASLDASVARNVSANVPVMTGDSGSGGAMGLVPAPAAGDAAAGKVLKADGTWYVPSAALPSGAANEVVATPNGASGTALLRALVPADLPVATTSALGAVKPDGSTITIAEGVISAVGSGSGMTNPMTTEGDLIIGGASGAPGRLAAGTSGYVLTSNGAGAAFSWQAASGGSSSSPSGISFFQGISGLYPTIASMGLTTSYNQKSTFSATNGSAGVVLQESATLSSDYWEGVAGSYPTAPFTLTAVFSVFNGPSSGSPAAGVAILDSLTGKLMKFGIRFAGGSCGWNVGCWSTPTTWASDLVITSCAGAVLLGIIVKDDGTNLTVSFSTSGFAWTKAYTVAKSSSYLGSSGFNYLAAVVDSISSSVTTTVLAWNVTYP